jgi:hypothetical protein
VAKQVKAVKVEAARTKPLAPKSVLNISLPPCPNFLLPTTTTSSTSVRTQNPSEYRLRVDCSPSPSFQLASDRLRPLVWPHEKSSHPSKFTHLKKISAVEIWPQQSTWLPQHPLRSNLRTKDPSRLSKSCCRN